MLPYSYSLNHLGGFEPKGINRNVGSPSRDLQSLAGYHVSPWAPLRFYGVVDFNKRPGSLSERQHGWVERQLNGTWPAVGSSQSVDTVPARADVSTSDADLIDVMIDRRLAAEGKAQVDAAVLARLKRHVVDLNDMLPAR